MVGTFEREVQTPAPEGSLDPYPGPRPFHAHERGLFFGRAREESQLRSIVLANSLVLLYAASGAGKTSLIHAGLIPALVKLDVTVFPVLRIRLAGEDCLQTKIANPFVRSLAANWAAVADESSPDPAAPSHGEQLADCADLPDLIRLLALESDTPPDEPRVLVIDQFEELFTYFPEHWESRGDFFAQVQRALDEDPQLRVLLSMREDFISQTDPYAGEVANRLQQRLRIETLHEAQALEAVTGPLAQTGRSFAAGAAEYLVAQLLQIRIERHGVLEKIRGEYVEPVQLQVVCQRLWEELPPTLNEITESDVRASGDVDEVLGHFYDNAVRDAAAKDRLTRERKIREWIEKSLITSLGTRGTAHRDQALKSGVPQVALDELVNSHLLRSEWRNGSDWYELTHDRLVGPVQSSNSRYHDALNKRRLRTAAVLLFVLAVSLAAVLLTGMNSGSRVTTRVVPGAAVVLPSLTPGPPKISVPANGGLYRRGEVFRAAYTCRSTAAWYVATCNGSVPAGAPIDTEQLGTHRFRVTASYGRSDNIVTSRSVTYTVVGFATTLYPGRAFSVSYPSSWHIVRAEQPQPGNFTDTTIVPASGPNTMLRVDDTSHPNGDLQTRVLAEVRAVSSEPRYRRLFLGYVTFLGLRALDWQFVVRQGGAMLRKDDEFFVDSLHGRSFALLTQAPVQRYQRLAGEFALLRGTLLPR